MFVCLYILFDEMSLILLIESCNLQIGKAFFLPFCSECLFSPFCPYCMHYPFDFFRTSGAILCYSLPYEFVVSHFYQSCYKFISSIFSKNQLAALCFLCIFFCFLFHWFLLFIISFLLLAFGLFYSSFSIFSSRSLNCCFETLFIMHDLVL